MATKEEAYIKCLNAIADLTPNDPITPIAKEIAEIPEDFKYKDAILTEMDKTRVFPDSMMKILTIVLFVMHEKKESVKVYEEAIEKYKTIDKLVKKKSYTEDEEKIRTTLSNFMVKHDSNCEQNDKAEEGVIREIGKFLSENGYKGGDLSIENLNTKLPQKYTGTVQPHLINLLSTYFNYKKTANILRRLIKIANYIIEDALKKA